MSRSTRRKYQSSSTTKRNIYEVEGDKSSSSLSPPPEEPIQKKSKKAKCVSCPVCEENIPVRLLSDHLKLELKRVNDMYKFDGSPSIYSEPGPSNPKRGAALKANQVLNSRSDPTIEEAKKFIQQLNRSRKIRFARYKAIIAQDELAEPVSNGGYSGDTCPVCFVVVGGDSEVFNAHIDSCIEHESRIQAEKEERRRRELAAENADPWTDINVGGEIHLRLNNVDGLRRLGVYVRDDTQPDIEEDVDVDGNSEDEYGVAQFTEKDVINPLLPTIPVQTPDEGDDNASIDIDAVGDDDGDDDSKTLRDLVAEGKVVTRRTLCPSYIEGIRTEVEQVMGVDESDRLDQAISDARISGDTNKLVSALENKVKQLESMRISSSTSSICRICLDPYSEPTVSTGCWHTCCRECWLRCLGSTKLCPICKRITSAQELRRIFM